MQLDGDVISTLETAGLTEHSKPTRPLLLGRCHGYFCVPNTDQRLLSMPPLLLTLTIPEHGSET